MARRVRATRQAKDWSAGFARAHRRLVAALLVGLLILYGSGLVPPAGTLGGAVLLIGGALVGLPHGSSDFVVAHRLLRPRLRIWWLPAFVAAYLLVTAAVLLGWWLVPGVTFVAFLAVSGWHFGAGDEAGAPDGRLRYLARAGTPIVPIFLCHPGDVAGIVGLMSDQPAAQVASILGELRPAGLVLYAALLGSVVSGAVLDAGRRPALSREAAELVLLALAGVLLPPLLAFALYFCLLHAVRHMAELGRASHPRDGRAALRLAAAIVVPSAIAFGLLLALSWDAVAGALSTVPLLAAALQLTAALTIPHVLLEWWDRHARTDA